jgi:mono/diheme cytochrome c family protein
MLRLLSMLVVALSVTLSVVLAVKASTPSADARVERGRYLVKIAGCNDCHTPGYALAAGAVPESQWLVGDALGWRGPWGTTYPVNLRLYMHAMTEEQWVAVARAVRSRPPMPWFALRDMTEEDLRSLYHFVRSLGPAGGPAPAYVPPGQEPTTAYIQFPAPPK